MKEHYYEVKMEWIGNNGQGTSSYTGYARDHIYSGPGKAAEIPGSSDPSFRGDPKRYNPEELLVASLSSCHMLWYLHLCSVNKIVVTAYVDQATGIMEETKDGSGRFKQVTLHPSVTIQSTERIDKAKALHHQANKMCFIANSCNFPVNHKPVIQTAD